MGKPIVGIPYIGKGVHNHIMLMHYMVALLRAGAKPIVLKRSTKPEVLEQYLAHCDGFLMPGGADIQPSRYGREKESACGKIDMERDAFELALLEMLLPTQKPILGICRGCQALAVASGGTLYQDITPLQSCQHNDKMNLPRGVHTITLQGESLLRDSLQPVGDTLRVNSMHHQAIEQPGEGVRVIARSSDGFIEAIQRDDRVFCVGVQWHPEHMAPRNKAQQRIFNTFVQACY